MSNTTLNFTQQFLAALEAAEEYGNDMESLYDEPNEYTTSKFESISLYLHELVTEWSDRDVKNIQVVLIPKVFADDVEQHMQRGCNCVSKELKILMDIFINATVQYI